MHTIMHRSRGMGVSIERVSHLLGARNVCCAQAQDVLRTSLGWHSKLIDSPPSPANAEEGVWLCVGHMECGLPHPSCGVVTGQCPYVLPDFPRWREVVFVCDLMN